MKLKNKIIVIFGPPGSGKGTQAQRIATEFDSVHVSTGNLLRQEVESETPLGQKIKDILYRGELVSDQDVAKLLDEKVAEIPEEKSIVLDGYPRNLNQAHHLEELLKNYGREIIVLSLEVDREALISRRLTRKICASCKTIYPDPGKLGLVKCSKCSGELVTREDDRPEVIEKRINVYDEYTKPLLDFYRNSGKLDEVDGNPSIDEVWKLIKAELEKDAVSES